MQLRLYIEKNPYSILVIFDLNLSHETQFQQRNNDVINM